MYQLYLENRTAESYQEEYQCHLNSTYCSRHSACYLAMKALLTSLSCLFNHKVTHKNNR